MNPGAHILKIENNKLNYKNHGKDYWHRLGYHQLMRRCT